MATTIDFAVLLSLVGAHVPPALGTVCGATMGGLANFFLSRLWVFQAGRAHLMRQLLLYAGVVVFIGALISGALVALVMHIGATVVIAKCVAAAVTMSLWNYPVSHFVVFRTEEEPCFR